MASPIWEDLKSPSQPAAAGAGVGVGGGGSTEDLTARMQHMIDLQHQQTMVSAGPTTSIALGETPERTSLLGATGPITSSLGSKRLSRSVGLASFHNLQQESVTPAAAAATTTTNTAAAKPVPLTEETNTIMNMMMMEPGVGRGTLYINSEKLGSVASAMSQSGRSDEEEATQSNVHRRMLLPKSIGTAAIGGQQQLPLPQHQPSYGSVALGTAQSSVPENSHLYHPQQQQQQQQQQREPPSFYPPNQATMHDYDFTEDDHPSTQQHPSNSPPSNILGTCCSCIWKVLYILLCCCSTDAVEEQALHRSFCFGAIDGMLTGSGIVAAFVGMSVLAPTSTLCIRSFVVAFSACACIADSICMALGHVWTTHVLVTASSRERAEQRKNMETNLVTSKGKLVDILLERGMLKIDAMSLVDTLEGYPDLFVSALIGDPLIAGGVGHNNQNNNNLTTSDHGSSTYDPSGRTGGWPIRFLSGGSPGHSFLAGRGSDNNHNNSNGSFLVWKFPSYGQHINDLDQEIDPEAALVGSAMTESRREGLFMMVGFSMFAILPSLIYLVIPMMIHPRKQLLVDDNSSSLSSLSTVTIADSDHIVSDGATSATSMVITTAAAIMWCLGVWKSRFLDSNWMLFGIETVVVLLICMGAAFGAGVLLRTCFPGLAVTIDSASVLDGRPPSFV